MPQNKEIIVLSARYVARLLVSPNLGVDAPARPEELSLRDVYLFAKKHSVAGAVFNIIEDEVAASSDAELIAKFERERELDCAKNLVQTLELERVSAAFAEAGVPFLPMKGFLFKALWGRPEWRNMSDLDIYVSAEGIDRAAEVLCSLGYRLDHDGTVHDAYVKPPYVNIELHRTLEKGDEGDFARWTPKSDNPYWYVMSDEDFLVFAISHMHKHYGSGGYGMRSLFDIYLYLKKKGDALDAEYVSRELSRRGLTEFYNGVILLSEHWFSDDAADGSDIAELEAYIASGGTYGSIDNKVKTSMRGKSRIGYYLSRFFLPYSSMVTIYKWLRPLPFLLPIAWILRIFTALFDGRLRRELRAVESVKREERED